MKGKERGRVKGVEKEGENEDRGRRGEKEEGKVREGKGGRAFER